jgi:hypothetical protein
VSQYQAFRRVGVSPQVAQKLETITFPAPVRGLIMNENEAFMQPGGAVVCDNWRPTMQGVSLRGGCVRWCALSETTPVISMFRYASGNNQRMYAGNATKLYDVTTTTPTLVKSGQTSGNYCAVQMANQGGDWMIAVNDNGDFPLRFNGSSWVVLNGTAPATWTNNTAYAVNARVMDSADRSYWKCAIAHTSALSGTFAADRAAHPSNWTPDTPSDGVSWIVGPPGSNVVSAANLTYACKYRNRLFFIEASSMNAWYLPLNAVGGTLAMIPLSGAATKGGKLLWCASWSLDAGDGIDDKLVFCTDLGELLIFTGSDPSSANSWKQEGRYQIPEPMGMNAHMALGGDILIATTSGIVPISASISKTPEELELAMITRQIKMMWRNEVAAKRSWSWTMENWPEYGGIFVTWPGGNPGNRYCATVNAATGAWARYVGWDVTCISRLRADCFFGTQDGYVMQMDRSGYDDGQPYVATLVGGWEVFQSPAQTITWRQARASFKTSGPESFQPQLFACTDYVVQIPTPPSAGPDAGTPDAWDEGHWGPDMGPPPPPVPTPPQRAQYAQWDQFVSNVYPVRNTMWVSIGVTGFSHAPGVQVTVGQAAKPTVDLIAVSATFDRSGINV